MNTPVQWSCVLFDLDGTIADSAAGITSTLAHTLETMGKPVPPPAELLAFVGPPIMDGFAALGLNQSESQRALRLYRARYAERGAFDSAMFPGIEETVRTLHDTGVPIALATSKPELQATRMLEHYGLADLFTFIGGASEDETRSEKADVIAYVLDNLRAERVDLSSPVMVGDRVHDVEGALANDLPVIFVQWGYGAEVEQAGSIAAVASPSELLMLLLPELAA
ncbi:MAG: haloacid dehalogenase [Naasia sp.]|jgi:phosphoglycolate phosphatase|uniref:HAD hydrolase-like protein n=1 Tax=Naasia sp. TaxID=2546198 RepID=UPI002617DCB6|nr:HAD hydrolase-like protein [Naasia sp.]MCU1570236.1 haloacid dehalogenase [Naasia sp.]